MSNAVTTSDASPSVDFCRHVADGHCYCADCYIPHTCDCGVCVLCVVESLSSKPAPPKAATAAAAAK